MKTFTELGNTFSEDLVWQFANLMNLCLPPEVIKHKMGLSDSMLQSVAQAYPTVTSIRVKDTLDAIARITDQLAFAVRGATSVARTAGDA